MIIGVSIEDNKLVIITEQKTFFFFYLSKDFDNNFKHEIDFFIKHWAYTKKQLINYCPDIRYSWTEK